MFSEHGFGEEVRGKGFGMFGGSRRVFGMRSSVRGSRGHRLGNVEGVRDKVSGLGSGVRYSREGFGLGLERVCAIFGAREEGI